MPTKVSARSKAKAKATVGVDEALAALKAKASAKVRAGMARYAIPDTHAWGVSVGDIRKIGKQLGRDHALAEALWQTGVYEARMLACFVDDPAQVTVAQMDRWCRDFDNWAICDTACFALFDRTPHAFGRVKAWASSKDEYVKRGAFALLASLAGHDKSSPPDAFLTCLPLVEKAATDERNFVKKGVSWALRGMGHRAALHEPVIALARRLAASEDDSARWVGKDALRDLGRPQVAKKLAARAAKAT